MGQLGSVLVVGSVALDTIECPTGKREAILGGSAVHFSLAARLLAPVSLVGIVGEDFPEEHVRFLRHRDIDLAGLRRAPGRTFRWHGRYEGSMNGAITIETQLNVFGEFRPDVPESARRSRFVLLGNASPQTQAHLLDQLEPGGFTMLDTMDLWIQNERRALEALLPRVTALSINHEEALLLTGEPLLARALRKLVHGGPRIVLLKKAEHGAILATRDFLCALPAFPTESVIDPTGAGDAFAGGFLGSLASQQRVDEESLRRALCYGTVLGSFAVEGFGTERLASLTRNEVDERVADLRRLTRT